MSLLSTNPYALLATAIAVYVIASHLLRPLLGGYKLKKIPTVGSSSIFSYYSGAFQFILNCREIMQQGYDKHYGSAFKIPQMYRWQVIVSGHEMVNDMRRATDDQLSFREAVDDTLPTKYMLGQKFADTPYHVEVIRGPLTRNIVARFPEVRDEIVASFGDEIPLTADWTNVHVMSSIRRIVSRTSNRLFVGLPLCRDPIFRNLNIDFTVDLVLTSRVLSFLPTIIRPLVAPLFRSVPRKIDTAIKLLKPIIEDRLKKDEMYGSDWEGRPNDLISWLLDEAPQELKEVRDLTLRILLINFAAIHTTSMTFANSIHHLAAYPEYLKPLREEIESVVNEAGWNKTALGKMRKLDSFIKEAQRVTGVGGIAMNRTALKDFTFSNGLTVPAGTFIATAAYHIHHDEAKYPDPYTFQGFRFAEMRDSSSSEALKHHMVTPTLDYLLFGHGRHACPGRFFAVNELKLMMAHVILNYDVKLANDSRAPPPPRWIGTTIIPEEHAEVLFRARAAT